MKHVGKMKNNSARVVVVYRTLPGDPNNCLVVGSQGLIDSYHDTLMSLIESDSGQQANELADILSVRKFPDGSNMLGFLHAKGHLRKVPTNTVLMTPNTQVTMPLNELNDLIAKQKGISISELAVSEEGASVIVEETTKEVVTLDTPKKEVSNFALTPVEMRARADALFKEASKLRKDADALDPPKKKTKSAQIEV